MKKVIKIIGQIITAVVFLILGISVIIFLIPGNRDFCDADQEFMFYFGIILIIVTLLYLINSIVFLIKKQWVKYRIIVISLTLLIVILFFSIRSIVTITFYGKTLYAITNLDNAYTLIDIRLFKNNKFISTTYDLSCNIENTGTYILTDKELSLEFNEEKSDYLDTRYKLICDTLKSINNVNINLIMKKTKPNN